MCYCTVYTIFTEVESLVYLPFKIIFSCDGPFKMLYQSRNHNCAADHWQSVWPDLDSILLLYTDYYIDIKKDLIIFSKESANSTDV